MTADQPRDAAHWHKWPCAEDDCGIPTPKYADQHRDAIAAPDREWSLIDDRTWQVVERAIWPYGPAHGTGSGAYAALKARVIKELVAALTTATPEPPLDVERLMAWLGPSHPHDEGRECGACAAYNFLAALRESKPAPTWGEQINAYLSQPAPADTNLCNHGYRTACTVCAAPADPTADLRAAALTARTAPVIDDYMPDATLAERQVWERAIRAALGDGA